MMAGNPKYDKNHESTISFFLPLAIQYVNFRKTPTAQELFVLIFVN